MKRQHKPSATAPAPILLFYAPLTQNKEAVYAHDGKLYTHYAGSNLIQNGELYNASRSSSYYTRWDSTVPVGVNLTFNCFITPTALLNSGINCMHGFSRNIQGERNTALFLIKHQSQAYNSIASNYITPFAAVPDLMTLINEKSFISWSIIFNGAYSYTVKFYKNGLLVFETTVSQPNWLGIDANDRFSIGIGSGTNNTIGYFSHFSVFEELSEIQIKTIYENGGIVTIP